MHASGDVGSSINADVSILLLAVIFSLVAVLWKMQLWFSACNDGLRSNVLRVECHCHSMPRKTAPVFRRTLHFSSGHGQSP